MLHNNSLQRTMEPDYLQDYVGALVLNHFQLLPDFRSEYRLYPFCIELLDHLASQLESIIITVTKMIIMRINNM